jgi:integrase
MGVNGESHCRRRELAENASGVPLHNPFVLLISSCCDLGQPAPLGLDALGVTISRTPAPMHGHDQADNAGDHPPIPDGQGDPDQQGDELHAGSLASVTDTPPRITRRRAARSLKGALHLAVMANVIGSNPVREVSPIRSKTGPKGTPALTADELRGLLAALRASKYCQKNDLVDPITVFIATGMRISELLGLRWQDFNEQAATLAITGKLVRAASTGLLRVDDETKTAAGRRTIPLPKVAAEVLIQRQKRPFLGEQKMIFPSTAGTWRDPDNFRARWRKARGELGVPDVTSHSFRKSLATLIDDEGLSARIGADHLGHARVSETQDTYMARGRVHTEVADLFADLLDGA